MAHLRDRRADGDDAAARGGDLAPLLRTELPPELSSPPHRHRRLADERVPRLLLALVAAPRTAAAAAAAASAGAADAADAPPPAPAATASSGCRRRGRRLALIESHVCKRDADADALLGFRCAPPSQR